MKQILLIFALLFALNSAMHAQGRIYNHTNCDIELVVHCQPHAQCSLGVIYVTPGGPFSTLTVNAGDTWGLPSFTPPCTYMVSDGSGGGYTLPGEWYYEIVSKNPSCPFTWSLFPPYLNYFCYTSQSFTPNQNCGCLEAGKTIYVDLLPGGIVDVHY